MKEYPDYTGPRVGKSQPQKLNDCGASVSSSEKIRRRFDEIRSELNDARTVLRDQIDRLTLREPEETAKGYHTPGTPEKASSTFDEYILDELRAMEEDISQLKSASRQLSNFIS